VAAQVVEVVGRAEAAIDLVAEVVAVGEEDRRDRMRAQGGQDAVGIERPL
jgi:hypothetical protein